MKKHKKNNTRAKFFPYLDECRLRIWKTTPMPEPLEHLACHRDIFYLLVCTGMYYENFLRLQKPDLKGHPVYGPYLHPSASVGQQLVTALWIFSDAMAILEKYMDRDSNSPWLLDRRYLTDILNFNRILARLSTTVMAWDHRVTSKEARNTYGYLLHKYKVPTAGIKRAFGEVESPQQTLFRFSPAAILDTFSDVNLTDMAGI